MKQSLKWISFVMIWGVVFLLGCPRMYYLLKHTVYLAEEIYRVRGDYERAQRERYPLFMAAYEARQVIPPGAKVEVSLPGNSIERVAFRYMVYPLEISPVWDYYVLVSRGNLVPAGAIPAGTLADGSIIYRNSETAPLLRQGSPAPDPDLLRPVIMFAVSVLANVLLGVLLLCVWTIGIQGGGRFWFLGAGYLLGVTVQTVSLWGFMLCGGVLNSLAVWGVWIFWVAVLAGILHGRGPKAYAGAETVIPERSAGRGTVIVLAAVLGMIVLLIALTPVSDWDSMAKWVLKAKVLYYKQALDFSYTHHNFYPLLWPLGIAAQFVLIRGPVDAAAQWTSALMFLCLASQLAGGLKFLGIKPRTRVLILIIFLAVFFSYRYHATANAENIFLAMTAAALAASAAWLRNPARREFLVLAVVFNAGICLAKFEGAVTAFFLATALIVLTRGEKQCRNRKTLLTGMLAVMALPVLWAVWAKTNAYYSSIVHLDLGAGLLARMRFLLIANSKILFKDPMIARTVLLTGVAMLVSNRRRWDKSEKMLLWVSAGLVAFSVWGNAGQPLEVIQGTVDDAFPRLFIHAAPALTLLLARRLTVCEERPADEQTV